MIALNKIIAELFQDIFRGRNRLYPPQSEREEECLKIDVRDVVSVYEIAAAHAVKG